MQRTSRLLFGEFELDPSRFELRRDGVRIELTPTPLRLLLYLVDRHERTVPKQELLNNVWPDAVVSDTALSSALKELRRALGDDGTRQRYVHTLRGLGYRFVAPVEESVASDVPMTPPSSAPPDEACPARYVAVLPFKNLSADPDNDYFADGVTEDIITQVAKIGGLRVVSTTSSRRYKDSERSLHEIARELRAGTVLEGSIRREGSRIRIAAQLIEAATDTHLWAESYDRELDDIFEIQREVAVHIAAALRAELTSAEQRRLARNPTGEIAAYDHYLRGRELYRRWSRGDNEKAIEMFQKALEIDPAFSLALAGLANAYALRSLNWDMDGAWAEEARQLAERALSTDPDLPEAHKGLGLAHMCSGRIRDSLECHLRAVELYPEYDEATHNIADLYFELGQWDECLRWRHRHLKINAEPSSHCLAAHPLYLWHLGLDAEADDWLDRLAALHPGSGEIRGTQAKLHIARGELEEARASLGAIRDPSFQDVTRWRLEAEIAMAAGEDEVARRLFELSLVAEPGSSRTRLGLARCLARAGEEELASKQLEAVEAAALTSIHEGHEWAHRRRELAAVAALRGDREAALAWLERAFDAGWRQHRSDASDPWFEDLRGDPSFETHLLRMRERVTAMRQRAKANGWEIDPATTRAAEPSARRP